MEYFSAVVLCLLLPTYIIHDVGGVIISPCKVRNLVAQPEYGTSLKTKGLVRIIQIQPVFVQNVMVGICENHNQNVSTGRMGEFYACQQRYSVVEVYTAESSNPSTDPYHQQMQAPLENLNDIRFSRESVIIESGCDFTFNLLPLIASAQAPSERPSNYGNPQQQVLLKSPYHQVYRQPPASSVPVMAPQPPQGVPVDINQGGSRPMAHANPTPANPSPSVAYNQGRANVDEDEDTNEDVDEENQQDTEES